MPRPEPEFRSAIISYLRKQRPDLCRHWFDDIEPVAIASGTVFLLVREPVQLNFLRRQAVQAFTEAVQAHTGKLLGVKFVDEPEAAALLASDSVTAPAVVPRSSSGGVGAGWSGGGGWNGVASESDADGEAFPLNPDCTFDHFVVGPCNKLAYAAARAVADQPGSAYNPLFIHSGVGLGKTHMLQAICQRLLSVQRRARIAYLPCNTFMERFTDGVQAGRMAEFRHRFRGADVLIIDDVHDLSRNSQSQEEFFHTFNALHQIGKQIVLSADAHPEEIREIEERLVSRFNCGLVAEIDRPCFETRKSIVKAKAALRNLVLPDRVVELIADRRQHNVRELEGALQALHLHHTASGQPIDEELALTALGESGPSSSADRKVAIGEILDLVAGYYNLRVIDLTGRARPRSFVVPRQVAMFLAKKLTHMSYAEIGGHMGGRDHTTVLHGYRTVAARASDESDLGRDLSRIEEQLLARSAGADRRRGAPAMAG